MSQTDSLMNEGRKAAKVRDFVKAKMFFQRALDKTRLNENETRAKIHNNLGILNYIQNENQKAINHYKEAISIYRIANNKIRLSETYNNLGIAQKRDDRFDEAMNSFHEAFVLASNNKLRSKILSNIGRVTFQTENYPKGISYFKKLQLNNPNYTIQRNIARLYKKTNRIDSSLFHYDKALALAKINQYSYVELIKEKADILYSSSKHKKALELYLEAIKLHETFNTSYYVDLTKIQANEAAKSIFTSAIECAAKLQDSNQALRIIEKFKAPILNEKLRINKLPGSLSLELKKINSEISQAVKNNNYENLNELFRNKEKLGFNVESDVINHFQQTLKKLPPNMAMVNYLYSDSLLTSIVYAHGELKTTTKKIDLQFRNDIEILHQQSKMFANSTYEKYRNYLRASKHLYKKLIPELSEDINRLLIIPYSELYRVPFEALTLSPPAKSWANFTKIDYLVAKYAVSYNTSLASLNISNNRIAKNAISIVPTYSDSLSLNHGVKEAKSLNKHIDTKILRGKFNTDSIVENLPKYDIISIVAHGKDGKIILNRDTMHIDNLSLLKLNNPLSVISTCKSNTGKLISNEGFLGTARKFIELGSQSVVASLFSIPDKPTSQIISAFYNYLDDGLEVDIALNKAKVDYLQNNVGVHRSPSFWAGIVLLGNHTPIKLKSNNFLIWILIASLVVIIGTIHFYRKNF